MFSAGAIMARNRLTEPFASSTVASGVAYYVMLPAAPRTSAQAVQSAKAAHDEWPRTAKGAEASKLGRPNSLGDAALRYWAKGKTNVRALYKSP
jgi:hypothetical protein